MTGFNLPPGCEVHHIPGNRPEDLAEDMFWDVLMERAPEGLPADWYEPEHPVAKLVNVVRELAYQTAWDDAAIEAELVAALDATDALDVPDDEPEQST